MANAITVSGTPLTSPVSPDPDLCRISGFLRDLHGNPLPGVGLLLVNEYIPQGIVTDTLILQGHTTVRADKDGYVEFDLLRKACVSVNLPNRTTDLSINLVVPDAASADLIDFLFPYLKEIEFVTADPASLTIGEKLVVELKGILSNLVEVELDSVVVTLASSAPTVLENTTGLTFTGLSVGTSLISVEDVNTAPLKLLLAIDETPITLFDQPAVVLPTDLTVNVS